MTKASGVFAGEVTPQAPAHNSPTSKRKGYHYFEYGIASVGICGTVDDLIVGTQLLGTTTMHNAEGSNNDGEVIQQFDAFEAGVSFNNTSVVSFTCAFIRDNAPDSGLHCPIIDVYNLTDTRNTFAVYMDSDGFIQVDALDAAGTVLLDVSISNNGSSFADATNHMLSVVIDLTDEARREILLNGLTIGENTNYVTWNTYVSGTIELADTGSAPEMVYGFGIGFDDVGNPAYGTTGVYNGTGWAGGTDALSFITFDDDCTLVPSAVWDAGGHITDPQKWEGWYIQQPQVFYTTSFWRNTGKTEPASNGANSMERRQSDFYGSGVRSQTPRIDENIIDFGIGGTLEAS